MQLNCNKKSAILVKEFGVKMIMPYEEYHQLENVYQKLYRILSISSLNYLH